MNYGIYSLYDIKSELHAQPFYAPNRSVAQRHLMGAMEDSQSLVSKFPGDFRLYELGTFDDSTGVIHVHTVPVLIQPNHSQE